MNMNRGTDDQLRVLVDRAVRSVVLESDEGGYTAIVPAMTGCISCGETPEEAMESIRDAIEAWIQTAIRFGDPLPSLLTDSDD